MTIEILLLLIAIAVSLVLFSIERLPADVIALGVLVFIIITGIVPPEKAFAGFGSDAVLMILGLLILTAALNRTGLVELIGRKLVQRTGHDGARILMVTMIVPALMSAVISNTAATAFFIPVVIGIARKARIGSSKLLMPLAFATILSSSVTLIATSTNIVVSGIMTQHNMKPIGMFELTPVGLPILILGIVYMLSIGRRLLPENKIEDETKDQTQKILPYLSEVVVQPDSPLVNKTLSESGLGSNLDLTVLRVQRGSNRFLAPQAGLRLQAGDVLLVEGQRDDILKIKDTAGVSLKAEIEYSDEELQTEDIRIVEAIVLLRSRLTGRTLRGAHLRDQYGIQVLAINRHGETIHRKLSQVRLQMGDILLIQGRISNIAALEADENIHILSHVEEQKPDTRRAPIAVAAFAIPLLLSSFELAPLSVAVLIGVLIVFATQCITPEEAYRKVEWKALILIGCMLGVGSALEYTGAAEFIAAQIVTWIGSASPTWLLAAFFLLTMLLTQPMSNQAAAAVVVPIALETAMKLGVNPRTFAVMIAVGASCSFLTPLEPACLMVYGPGRYRFSDFLKVGSILSLIIFIIAIILVPIIWPL